jgi:predicted GNAT family acetyltransferase
LTGAVAAELVGRGVRTVALNVNQGNATAIRVYERLGFVRYCAFVEGVAVRRRSVLK